MQLAKEKKSRKISKSCKRGMATFVRYCGTVSFILPSTHLSCRRRGPSGERKSLTLPSSIETGGDFRCLSCISEPFYLILRHNFPPKEHNLGELIGCKHNDLERGFCFLNFLTGGRPSVSPYGSAILSCKDASTVRSQNNRRRLPCSSLLHL